jgi:hypothetical protein
MARQSPNVRTPEPADPGVAAEERRLDVFLHGPLGEIIERFRERLLDEAQRIAGNQAVDASHLERAYHRLLPPPQLPSDWPVVNRRRVYLIQKQVAGDILPAESAELERLQAEADRHLSDVAPRPLEALWELERELRQQ